MTSYNGWTEKREYRIWQGEDIYSAVSVDASGDHRVRIFIDSEFESEFTSLESAYSLAYLNAVALMNEVIASCGCGETAEECGRVYDAPHAVRLQVVDVEENRTLEPYEYES